MNRGVIKRLVPAISSIREVAAEIQKEAYEKKPAQGNVTDHDGVDSNSFSMKGLDDLIEKVE